MDSVPEFIRYLFQRDSEKFFSNFDSYQSEVDDPCTVDLDKLIHECYDSVDDYIKSNARLLKEYQIAHEGGDEWVYEEGIWYTELYEIDGWYFWREPEGATYGLYESLESALSDRWKL